MSQPAPAPSFRRENAAFAFRVALAFVFLVEGVWMWPAMSARSDAAALKASTPNPGPRRRG